MKIKPNWIIPFLLLSGCSASATPSVWPSSDSTVAQTVALPMVPRQTEATQPPSPTLAILPTLSVQENLTPPPSSLLAGLVYSGEQLSLIQSDGSVQVLYPGPADAVSPDLEWAVVENNGDLWLEHLTDRDLKRLTLTETRLECCASWWINHPDHILLLSRELYSTPGTTDKGLLSMVKVNGSGYRTLDPEHPSDSKPAVSPEGTWIAYGSGTSGWLFGGEAGPQEIRPADFGIADSNGTLSYPAWSPDGKRLVWLWKDPAGQIAPLILNLEEKTGELGKLTSSREGSFDPHFTWSPDGRWLAYTLDSTDPALSGLWMLDTAVRFPSAATRIHPDLIPFAWSPDGHYLALSTGYSILPSVIWLLDSHTWNLTPTNIQQQTSFLTILAWR